MEILTNAGAPVNGTNEVQRLTLTGSPTGGTFRLQVAGGVTQPIAYNASAATIQAALRAVPTVGSAGVTCTGGPLNSGFVVVTFGGKLGRQNVATMAVRNPAFVGGTAPAVAVTTTTPGVDATHINAVTGQVLSDTTNGVLYINTSSTRYAPTWAAV
jgi:hypothetical protein